MPQAIIIAKTDTVVERRVIILALMLSSDSDFSEVFGTSGTTGVSSEVSSVVFSGVSSVVSAVSASGVSAGVSVVSCTEVATG